jgi:hypothetical protein
MIHSIQWYLRLGGSYTGSNSFEYTGSWLMGGDAATSFRNTMMQSRAWKVQLCGTLEDCRSCRGDENDVLILISINRYVNFHVLIAMIMKDVMPHGLLYVS